MELSHIQRPYGYSLYCIRRRFTVDFAIVFFCKAQATESRCALAPELEDVMPHYFFDIVDGEDLPDLQGSEWPDLAAARREAVRYSAEVLKEMPERFWNCEAWKMTVSDADRVALFTLKFLAESAEPLTV